MGYDPAVEVLARRGQPLGYASLDAAGLVPVAQLPALPGPGLGAGAGIVPDPGPVAGTSRVLTAGGWAIPPGGTVARFSHVAASAAVPTTGLYTPTADTLVRVLVYAVLATAGTSGTLALLVSWTEAGIAATTTVSLPLTPAGGYATAAFQAAVDALTPLSYALSYTGTAGAAVWDAHGAVRRLATS